MLIEARALTCSRTLDREGPSYVKGVGLSIPTRTLTLIRGPEGCGKNLLLRLLGLQEIPDGGEVFFKGRPTAALGETERAAMCNRHFGFVFTTPFLLPAFSAMENIAMPLFKVSEVEAEEARTRVEELLRFVGLEGRGQEPVSALSAPEQYRVSLARALANRPDAIFVENLDGDLAGEDLNSFAERLEHAVLERGVTAIATASNRPDSILPDREIEMAEGAISEDSLATGKPEGKAS